VGGLGMAGAEGSGVRRKSWLGEQRMLIIGDIIIIVDILSGKGNPKGRGSNPGQGDGLAGDAEWKSETEFRGIPEFRRKDPLRSLRRCLSYPGQRTKL